MWLLVQFYSGPENKPLPYFALNPAIDIAYFCHIRVLKKHYSIILSVNIKYSMRDVMCDVWHG